MGSSESWESRLLQTAARMDGRRNDKVPALADEKLGASENVLADVDGVHLAHS